MSPDHIILSKRQAAGAVVQEKMMQFLLQYDPVRDLTIASVKDIAAMARVLAFDASSKIIED